MVTCLRMPEKRSDGIWVTECCSVAWEGSVDFICCPVAGKAASLYLAQFDPLYRSESCYRLIDSGSVQYYGLSWVLTTHKPSSLFWVLLFVLRKGLFLRPGWLGLCVDQAGLKLRAICHQCLSSAGTTDVHHHIWSLLCFENTSDSVSE